jgi:hypothetical protein
MQQNHSQDDVLSRTSSRLADRLLVKRAGVLLLDAADDRLYVSLLELVSEDQDVSDWWACLQDDFMQWAGQVEGADLLTLLGNDCSHLLQVEGPRRKVDIVYFPTSRSPFYFGGTLFENHTCRSHLCPRTGEIVEEG